MVLASLFFYSWWNPIYLPLIMLSMAFNYWIGNTLARHLSGHYRFGRKSILVVGVIGNLSLLGYFKYADFFISNMNWVLGANVGLLHLALPLAISFFTFQQIAYLVDSYRLKTEPAILNELHSGIDLARRVMSERSVGFLRSHEIPHQRSPQWVLMHKAHPTGITPAADSEDGSINLEATLRHMYFEETTHLYNIQRLKRAQGLQATVRVPEVGYWVLEGWDRSEP